MGDILFDFPVSYFWRRVEAWIVEALYLPPLEVDDRKEKKAGGDSERLYSD